MKRELKIKSKRPPLLLNWRGLQNKDFAYLFVTASTLVFSKYY